MFVFIIDDVPSFGRYGESVLQSGGHLFPGSIPDVDQVDVIQAAVPGTFLKVRNIRHTQGKIGIFFNPNLRHFPVGERLHASGVQVIDSRVRSVLQAGPHDFLVGIDERIIPVPDIHLSFFEDLLDIKKIDLFLGLFLFFFGLFFLMELFRFESEKEAFSIPAPGNPVFLGNEPSLGRFFSRSGLD